MKTQAIYMRNKTTGTGKKLPARSTDLLASLLATGDWEEAPAPKEEPRKRPRRTKDYYFTPTFQGW